MKILRRIGKFLAVVAVTLAVGVMFGNSVLADDTPEYRIQLSPATAKLDLDPGETTTVSFQVQNTGTKEFEFALATAPFSVSGDNYAQDYETETKYTDIAKWITLSDTKGTLAPQAVKDITVTIKVPRDVPAGGQYAVVLAKIVNSESGGNGVAVTRQVGYVVYANVNGQTRQGGEVKENKVASFLFKPPIQATSLVENTGNTHMDAIYILQVWPFFGGEEVYTNEETPEKRTILPETRRFNTMSWDGAPQLGLFRVKQTVKFNGQTSITEKVVVICPIWFLFIIVLLLFCMIFWIISRVRARKQEKE